MWTMSDELSASPVYTRQLAGISKLVRAELDHPRIVAVRAELAALGARRRADGAHFDEEEGSAFAAAIDAAMAVGYAAIEEEAPSFQRLFGRGGVTTLLITAFDEELGPLLPLRLLNIPEYPPRPFRLLLHDADVQEMAGQLAVVLSELRARPRFRPETGRELPRFESERRRQEGQIGRRVERGSRVLTEPPVRIRSPAPGT